MPRGAQVKVITKQSKNASHLSELFAQYMGLEKPDPNIVYVKHCMMHNLVGSFGRLCKSFATSPLIVQRFTFAHQQLAEMIVFGDKCINLVEEPLVSASLYNDSQQYLDLKKSPITLEIIKTHSRFARSSALLYLDNYDNLDQRFITDAAGAMCPFSFSEIDFLPIWASPLCEESIQKYIMISLHLMFNSMSSITKIVSSPDVDIDEFASVLTTSIGELRNHPELRQCKDAFRAIENSVGMLKSNFDNYYKSFLETRTSVTLIECFIKDVASAHGAEMGGNNIRLAVQLKKIVAFYQKQMQGHNIKDERLNGLFSEIGDLFKQLDGNSGIE
jgi:hypothetical protein